MVNENHFHQTLPLAIFKDNHQHNSQSLLETLVLLHLMQLGMEDSHYYNQLPFYIEVSYLEQYLVEKHPPSLKTCIAFQVVVFLLLYQGLSCISHVLPRRILLLNEYLRIISTYYFKAHLQNDTYYDKCKSCVTNQDFICSRS